MSFSIRSHSRAYRASARLIVIFITASLAVALSPVQAEIAGDYVRRALPSVLGSLHNNAGHNYAVAMGLGGQVQSLAVEQGGDPSQSAQRVTHFRLCPRRIVLYTGEAYTLVPLPLDANKAAVDAVAPRWDSSNPNVAGVSSWGEVSAIAPGHAVVTAQAGTGRATVPVEVREGGRPRQTDLQYDLEHAGDCDDPEAVGSNQFQNEPAQSQQIAQEKDLTDAHPGWSQRRSNELRDEVMTTQTSHSGAKARPAVLRSRSAEATQATRASLRTAAYRSTPAAKKNFGRGFFSIGDPIDGSGGDPFSGAAAAPYNAIGSSRFGPQEMSQSSSTKTKNLLGSYDFVFSAPVLNLGGRGIGADLALTYNSRLWSKDTNGMTFNYNKGWPSAGWTLGYGRIIQNYDNTGIGDQSGIGFNNAPGNYLLLQPDGTRVHLKQTWDPTGGVWNHESTDGPPIYLNPRNGKLRYSDGTLVKYDLVNNRLLPTSIRTKNGDLITIGYREFIKNQPNPNDNFPFRWAIDHITDSLGRNILFNYNPTTHYLISITAPNFDGGTPRTLMQIDYRTITLQYNFSVAVDQTNNPATGSSLDVINRIYYPATGRGFLFPDYGSYGMIRCISTRNNMTGAGGAVTDGGEVAYTKYDYVDVGNQVGQLNDSPQYSHRSEWWQGITDDSGNSQSGPTIYTYTRTLDNVALTQTNTVAYPNNLQVETVSDNNPNSAWFGRTLTTVYRNGVGGAILRQLDYDYTVVTGGTYELYSVVTTDDIGQKSKVAYDYGTYVRMTNVYEYGFKSGTWTIKRRKGYQYSDDAAEIGANLLQLVTEVDVYDALNDNDNANDVLMAKTVYSYDNYTIKGGMEYYGLTAAGYPPNHDAAFDQNATARGNVTGVQTFSGISPAVSTTRYSKYDIFGNVVQADVSCCQVKNLSFNSTNYWSQPASLTDGTAGVQPFLTTSYQYDFNTGLPTQSSDPNNLITYFGYDSAWRLLTVTAPSGAVTTTSPDKDSNGNDQLAYVGQSSYTESGGGSKVITNKSWFDGAGRALRSGSGAGSAPASFDAVATVYDSMGRVLKKSNPYAGDSSGSGSPSYWTTNSYDKLSRVMQVTLPDSQVVQTSYSGSTATVTDQVGRQRQSTADGLGRLISVIEQNPATGLLDSTNNQTTYAYDVLDNLTQVNQGNQLRTFTYDAMSRVKTQATPEAGTTTFTYTSFDAVYTRTDPRGAVTTYKYDNLNRLTTISYDTASAPGVAATPKVTYNYSTTGTTNGLPVSISVGTYYVESYQYDSVNRLSTRTRTIDGNTYATNYSYNTASQVTHIVYPDGLTFDINHDQRGRLSGLGTYANNISYNVAGQVSGLSLGNGVTEIYDYDPQRLQMNRQRATKGASTLMDLNYNYQAAAGQSGVGTVTGNSGQLMNVTSTPPSTINGQSRSQDFTYDNNGRLKTATGWGAWQRRYGYDRWGNRTGMWDATSGGNQLQNIAIATTGSVANNRIANVNGVTYDYDGAGNTTFDGAHSYEYDAENRLVMLDGGELGTYSYDHANRRVKKIVRDAVGYYVWEGSQVIAEGGTTPTDYVYAGSRMVARSQSGVVRYYHQDRLSARLITDSNGTVMGTEDHFPFGEDAGVTGESEKHRFTSYERDSESGSDYAINRQHQSANGRFMRADPLAGSIIDPQSLNRYAYTAGDSINRVDPLGLVICTLDGIQTDCGFVLRLIGEGNWEKIIIVVNGVPRTIDRNSFYEPLSPSDPNVVRIGTTFNNSAFEAAVQSLVGLLAGAGVRQETEPLGGVRAGDFGGGGASDTWEDKPGTYGPFSRRQTASVNQLNQSTGLVGGKGAFGGVGIPAVKAFDQPLPPGFTGIEFYTNVKPSSWNPGGLAYWQAGTPGVVMIDDETVGIPAIFTKRVDTTKP